MMMVKLVNVAYPVNVVECAKDDGVKLVNVAYPVNVVECQHCNEFMVYLCN